MRPQAGRSGNLLLSMSLIALTLDFPAEEVKAIALPHPPPWSWEAEVRARSLWRAPQRQPCLVSQTPLPQCSWCSFLICMA